MSSDNVTPLRPGSDRECPSAVSQAATLNREIGYCRAALNCAVQALQRAEDGCFDGESATLAGDATRLVERCTRDLMELEFVAERLTSELLRSLP
jgi:hypothetical protein